MVEKVFSFELYSDGTFRAESEGKTIEGEYSAMNSLMMALIALLAGVSKGNIDGKFIRLEAS